MCKLILYNLNDKYLLESVYGKVDLLIDEKVVRKFRSGWLTEKPKEIKLINKKMEIVRYGDLLPEEFENQKKELVKNAKYIGGEYYFDDLDEEYKYKKFIKDHPPEFVEREVYCDVQIIEHDLYGKLDHPYIKPFRFIGKHPIDHDKILYEYTPNLCKMMEEIGKKYGFKRVYDNYESTKGKKWYLSEYSCADNEIKYLKINDRYIKNKYKNSKLYRMIGTYEKCEKQYKKDCKMIEELFKYELAKIESIGKDIDRAKVILKLEHIKDMISQIECKPSDINREIEKFISELLEGNYDAER